VSGTVYFNTAPTTIVTATNGSASSGSTALTIVAPTYGSIVAGDPVGGAGIAQGTLVAVVNSTTSITLTMPTTAAISSGSGISFWSITQPLGAGFGRYSTCLDTAIHTYSGLVYDPLNDWGAFAPN